MRPFIRPVMAFREINRKIWLLPNRNAPIFTIGDLFQSDQNIEKKDHTHQLLASCKKIHISEPKLKIEENDYDLLSCL